MLLISKEDFKIVLFDKIKSPEADIEKFVVGISKVVI
jgi:hypothetical protein